MRCMYVYVCMYACIKRIQEWFFHFEIILLNKCARTIIILLLSFKIISIYLIFVKLLMSLKRTSKVYYNMKVQNTRTYNFDQNQNNFNQYQNFIKITIRNLYLLA